MPSKTLDRNCISAWKKATPVRVQPTNLAISCFNIEKCQDKDLFIYNTKWKLSTNKPKMHGITNEKMRQTWVLLSLRLLGCWEECISNGQIIRNIITSYCIKYLLSWKKRGFLWLYTYQQARECCPGQPSKQNAWQRKNTQTHVSIPPWNHHNCIQNKSWAGVTPHLKKQSGFAFASA